MSKFQFNPESRRTETGDSGFSSLRSPNLDSPDFQNVYIKNSTKMRRNMNIPNKLRRTGIRMKTIGKQKIQNIHIGTQLLDKSQVWEKQYANSFAARQLQESYLDNSNEDLSLIISNLPNSWNTEQIKDFIETKCGKINCLELIDNEDSLDVKVQFKTKEQFEKSKEIFDNKIIEETNSEGAAGEYSQKENLEAKSTVTPNAIVVNNRSTVPEFDLWENDPQGLYGLKPEFLDSLNITPPINNWVHVSNFRCDKSELRDAMELAGRVLFCAVVTNYAKYAKVMYSHPLEAVQAVSMLHDQKFYGAKLNVTMEVNANNIVILPKGLRKIGPGLGKLGRPIRNIAQQYERYINNQSSLVNPDYFMDIDKIDKNVTTEKVKLDSHENGKGVNVAKYEVVIKNNKKANGEENNSHVNVTQQSAQRPLAKNIHSNRSNTDKFQVPLLPLKVRLPTPRTETPYFRPPLPRPLNPTQEAMANLPPANGKNVIFQNMYLNPLLRPRARYPFAPPREFHFRTPQNVMKDTNTRQNFPSGTDYYNFQHAGFKSSEPNPKAIDVGARSSGPSFLGPRPLFPNYIVFPHPHTRTHNLPDISSSIKVEPTVTNPVTPGIPLSGAPGLHIPSYFGFTPPVSNTEFGLSASTSLGSGLSEHGPGVFRPPGSGPPRFDSTGVRPSGPGFIPLGYQDIPPNNPQSFFSEPKSFGSFGSGRRRTGRRGSHPFLLTIMPKPSSSMPPARPVAVTEVKVDIEEPEVDAKISPIKLQDATSNILSNLPPNTTLQILCDKVSQYEQELSIPPGQPMQNNATDGGAFHDSIKFVQCNLTKISAQKD